MTKTSSSLISETDVYSYFGSTYAGRGSSYQRSGRVLSAEFNQESRILTGEVQGARSRPYTVKIKLGTSGDRIANTSCSCPMGGYCKHAAALLLDLIRTGRHGFQSLSDSDAMPEKRAAAAESLQSVAILDKYRTQTAPVGNSKQSNESRLSAQCRSWLNSLSSGQSPETQRFEQNKKQSQSSSVLYLLEDTPYSPQLRLKVLQARRLKNGTWGKPQRADIERLSVGSAQYVTAEDNEIGRLFASGRQDSSWIYRDQFPEIPELSQIILERMLATGRCFWKELNEPLSLGSPKQGKLSWQTRADGKQVLKLSSGDPDDRVVVAGAAWYVDPTQKIIGRLDIPGGMKAFRAMLSAPPLDPVEAQAASEALAKIGSLIPLPNTDLTIETKLVSSTPCLTLSSQDFNPYMDSRRSRRYSQKLTVALLKFDYGADKFKSPEQLEFRTVNGNRITIHKKDTSSEQGHKKVLEQFGLQDTNLSFLYGNDGVYSLIDDNELAWFKFYTDVLPQLKDMGWNVKCDESFDFEVMVPDEQWSADASEGSDFWFSLDLGINVNGKRVALLPIIHEAIRRLPPFLDPMAELERLNHDGNFYAPLPDGKHVALPFERVKTIVEVLFSLFDRDRHLTISTLDLSFPQVLDLAKALDAASGDGSPLWHIGDKLKHALEKVKQFQGLKQIAPPKSFQAELRPYQLEGLSWLDFLREFELGGILADDMGLGKTVQALAHIAVEKSEKRLDRPVLVVCPTSVLPNWASEIEKFTPTMKTTTLWGPERAGMFPEIAKSDIVLTTYPLLARDVEVLAEQSWKTIILDEAQMIKNPNTQVAQAARKLRADYRMCLTGTPVENHLGELWSQFNFLMPGFLKDLPSFTRTFRTPIEKQKNAIVQKRLSTNLRPFILRRTKELVAKELPEKTTIIKRVELEGTQRDLYETVRLAMYEKVKGALASKGLAKSQIIILDALLKLRQVCCDPRLVSLPAAKKVHSTAKLELLLAMLEELLEEGKRILLFSQFTSMLDLVVPELEKRKIDFVEIRGNTKDRATPVKQFQKGEIPLFLLSLKAGGFGLNLTKADTVIHYDPWWNPAVENQATDRAHRIGQKQSVFVFKLIAAGTIEERMLDLQERKKAIADGVYTDENSLPSKLTAEDLESLFSPLGA